ncbi:MAG: response regulator transcription factor, partial [Pseudomonadota bacterium]
LDINLPGKSGLEILQNLRARDNGMPVILLSARTQTADRVSGLDMGADDYLIKPFEMKELEARIRALSRRRDLIYAPIETLGPLRFNRTFRNLTIRGETIALPRRELAALECLLERHGTIISKNTLLDHIYGVGSDINDVAVEPHISRLRNRLKPYGVEIKSARGLGYMLRVGQ